MKTLIQNYTFDSAARQITFDEAFGLDQILLITNVTRNKIIYNFATPALGGSMSGKVLTLNADLALMDSGDILQIYVDVAEQPATEKGQSGILNTLQRILNALLSPLGFDKTQARSRVTAVLESGTVTTVTTVSAVSTVSNVSTVDSLQGRLLINGSNMAAWQFAVREKIS